MIGVSADWADTLDTSHIIHSRVEVWLSGAKTATLPVAEGSVTLDMDAESYGSVTLQVADPDLVARDPLNAVLLPYGQRLRVYYTLQTPKGPEEIALGCDFLITHVPTAAGWMSDTQVGASTTIEMVKDARFLSPYQPAAGASVKTTLTGLLTQAVAGATVTYDMTADKTLSATPAVYERERWDAVQDLAGRLDGWVKPTRTGFRVAKLDDDTITGTPVWVIAHGANLMSGTRPQIARDDRYNAVVAYNPEKADVWAAAYVTGASQPARWDGPYGRRPAFFASTLLDTDAEAQLAANTRLKTINGKARVMTLETVNNPAIEPGDILQVVWPNQDAELVQVRKAEYPLLPGSMKLTVQGSPV